MMYSWVQRCLAAPAGGPQVGLYYDHIDPDGSVGQTIWSCNQGTMIGTGVMLARATGDGSYLRQAVSTAEASVAYFGSGARLFAQGPAFNGIYFRNLALLSAVVPEPAYRAEAESYGAYLWGAGRDPATGLFSSTWGPGTAPLYDVNGTAGMVEVFSLLASW